MWQRIQTLYMALAALISISVVFLFPVYINGEVEFYANQNPVILFFFGFSSGALIANVFNFKKRKLQIVLNRAVLIVNLILLGFIVADLMNQDSVEAIRAGLAMYMPLLNIILVFLANRAITKDEKLIRSADRIR